MGTEYFYERYKGIEKYTINPTEIIEGRLQFNENLWGPSSKCLECLREISFNDLIYYDLSEKDYLIESIADQIGVDSECVFVNAGSSEIIKAVFSVTLQKDDVVLIPNPGWGCYKGMIGARLANTVCYSIREGENSFYHDINDIISKTDQYNPRVIVITSPQMPTGNLISEPDLIRVIENARESIILLDECYYGCAEWNIDEKKILDKYENVIIVRSLSKIYGLANLRVGYGIANKRMIDLIDYVLPLHKLPNIVRKIAKAAIDDIEYTSKNRKQIIEAREYLTEQLNSMKGIMAYNSYANFVYAKIQGYDVKAIHKFLEAHEISIRMFEHTDDTNAEYQDNYGYFRITVAPIDIIDRMLALLKEACECFCV